MSAGRSRRRVAMPERLAGSALKLFSRRGIERTSLDQVAAEAGVTKGSLYWHFRSKQELVKAACTHYYRGYLRRMHVAAAYETDPLRRLERILQFALRTCLEDDQGRVFAMEILAAAVHDEDLRQGWRQFYDAVREFIFGAVEAARLAGQIDPPDSERVVNFMLETLEGIKLRAFLEPGLEQAGEEARTLEDLKGLLGSTPS